MEAMEEKPKHEPKNTVKDLNNEAREFLLMMTTEHKDYKAFLATVAKFPSYSAMNATHIHKHAPDAQVLKDSDTWNEEKNSIKKGEAGIPVTYPEIGKNGQLFFKVKYLFSDQQVAKPPQVAGKEYDEKLLGQAFEKSSAPVPTTPEGKFIVGQHFGLPSYLKDGVLPPADLMMTDDAKEACDNIKNYVDDIRKDANQFIRSVESSYKELYQNKTQEQNASLFQSYLKAGERQERSAQSVDMDKAELAEKATDKAAEEAIAESKPKDDFEEKLDKAEKAVQDEKNQSAADPAKKDSLEK